MRVIQLFISLQLIFLFASANSGILAQTESVTVVIETGMGTMKCILYEETFMHTDNFIKLSGEGFFNGQLFHRVINEFMIQAGDPDSKNAAPGQALGFGGPGYTIPAEIYPFLYHKKGALAAARQGDEINPDMESSGSQFYIVQGKIFTDTELDRMEANGTHIRFTPIQRRIYKTTGGAPHLDYAYTVFGEVTEGFDVLDRIASVPTDTLNRPFKDVKILKVSVLK